MARFVIGVDGKVTQISDAGSNLADQAAVDCVLGAFSRIAFPPPQGGSLSVVYPLQLAPDDASPDAGAGSGLSPAALEESVGAALSVPTPAQLTEMVRVLGTSAGPDPVASGVLDQLRLVPVAAARLLVQELRVLGPDASSSVQQHLVWCVRALRVLTGRDYRFPTKTVLAPAQREIYDDAGPSLAYFRVRISSGKLALAPRDVQQQIIAAWHEWLSDGVDSLKVPDQVEFADWYF